VLMKNADTAMYHAKNSGRNNFQFFNSTMLQTVQKRLSIETQLRRALENNEFLLYYQPMFRTDTIQMIGVEALVRWRTADGTLVPPDKFIGIAEEIGLIIPIGAWVLQEACRQMIVWDKQNLGVEKISVNLSARQLSDPELLSMVTDTLNRTMFSPTRLVFEITESALMRKQDEAVKVLKNFKEMGIKLAIDDFGTGYSSFAYLKHLPVHQLKIDRSFINNIADNSSDAKITATIITLAHGLELGVVAEGVETKEQLAILQQYCCDEMQGYLFSRPLDAEGITKFMSQSPAYV
jgi:EAL domain-containing protein (putative c-di-GMP-specific phosphodiesterase class I)